MLRVRITSLDNQMSSAWDLRCASAFRNAAKAERH
jgi:hypothetical protein